MEMPEAPFLYNVSLLGITFSAVSTLVMLLRQAMGGKVSNFDIYLITSYVSVGFLIAMDAVLPPMVFSFGCSAETAWVVAGLVAAFITGWTFLRAFFRRRRAARAPMSAHVVISFVCYAIVVLIFLADALVPELRSGGPYEFAITFLTGAIMWTFVRRVESLLGEDPGTDWNPSRG
jgi:hypothetical protein